MASKWSKRHSAKAVKMKEVLFVCKSGFLVVISGVFMKIWGISGAGLANQNRQAEKLKGCEELRLI